MINIKNKFKIGSYVKLKYDPTPGVVTAIKVYYDGSFMYEMNSIKGISHHFEFELLEIDKVEEWEWQK